MGAGCRPRQSGVMDERDVPWADLPRLDGDLLRSEYARALAADDFGHLVSRRPLAVLRPGSVADVAAVVRWAGDHGLQMAARGQGHSVYGRAQVADGIVVDTRPFDAVRLRDDGNIEVGAGATWRDVAATALRAGLTTAVLPNYLDLSIGGTVSVGGVGATSHRHGLVTDTVTELEVVTGEGEVLTCSRDENAELFDHVRAGLGQFGIITRAVLSLIPAPARVRRFTLRYAGLSELAADQELLLRTGRADHLQGAAVRADGGWRYQLELAAFHAPGREPDDADVLADLADLRPDAQVDDVPYREHLEAFDRFTALLRSTGEWSGPHPWLLTFLPGSAAVRTARGILDDLTADDLGDHGLVLFYPLSTAAIATPLARLPDEPVVYPFNLVRFVSRPDAGRAAAMVRQNHEVYGRVRAAGGTLYPVSALDVPVEEHLGERWADWRRWKERADPLGVLTPGYRPPA